MAIKEVSERYLELRQNALDYTFEQMNLQLENDKQVYLAVFDIPVESAIIGNKTKTLVLVFGLNIHIYCANGDAVTGLEQNAKAKQAMQSLFISCPQALDEMTLTHKTDFYESKNVRAYLKTRKGVYFKELTGETKKERFLEMLMRDVTEEVNFRH